MIFLGHHSGSADSDVGQGIGIAPRALADNVQIIYTCHIQSDCPGLGDIPDGSWHEMPVKWAKYAGLISGRGQGLFAPDDSVTRQEAAVIFVWASFFERGLCTK